MDLNSLQVQISICALLFSLLSITISVYDKIIRNIPKFKVEINVVHQFEIGDIKNTIEVIIDINITNVGHIVRDIEAPIVRFYGFTVNGKKEFSIYVPTMMVNFPKEIDFGKRFKYPFVAERIMKLVGELETGRKAIRVLIYDTHGRKYLSNRIRIDEIKKMIIEKEEMKNRAYI